MSEEELNTDIVPAREAGTTELSVQDDGAAGVPDLPEPGAMRNFRGVTQGAYITGTIDVARFVRAQSEFIMRQSAFLRRGRTQPGSPEYIRNVEQYSLAQAAFIEAQTEVLKQLGVVL